MKRYKEILTLLLSIITLGSLLSCKSAGSSESSIAPAGETERLSATSDSSSHSFSDVPADADYAQAVVWCYENGLMNGTSVTTFSPSGTLTRAMLATVLYRAAGEPPVDGDPGFADAQAGIWYSNAVLWASREGMLRGYGNSLFGTDDPVTVEQLEVVLGRYMGKNPEWVGDAARNIPATRAQIATALYNAMALDAAVPGPATLLYQGQASIRIVTDEGKVIYIDPYTGEGYDLPADLILVTHGHYDHNAVEKVATRSPNCQIITHQEAIQDDQYQIFTFDYVTVEPVEAGYNRWHDVKNCVGYVLTFSNGASIYVTGDTSTTEQMPKLAEKEIDYAFFCCDGVFNMGLEEAAQAAKLVKAKHNIPYHVTASNDKFFDWERAEQFQADNRLILAPGEELVIEKDDNAMEHYDFSAFRNVEITSVDLSSLSREQLEVLYRQARYCQAMTDADTDTLRELVAADKVFTHMSGRQQTREEYLADIENGGLRYFTIGIEGPTISVDGNLASITYTSVLNANAYGARGTYRMSGTHWFERIEGEWISINAPSK